MLGFEVNLCLSRFPSSIDESHTFESWPGSWKHHDIDRDAAGEKTAFRRGPWIKHRDISSSRCLSPVEKVPRFAGLRPRTKFMRVFVWTLGAALWVAGLFQFVYILLISWRDNDLSIHRNLSFPPVSSLQLNALKFTDEEQLILRTVKHRIMFILSFFFFFVFYRLLKVSRETLMYVIFFWSFSLKNRN